MTKTFSQGLISQALRIKAASAGILKSILKLLPPNIKHFSGTPLI
jgi:hypothetical protein